MNKITDFDLIIVIDEKEYDIMNKNINDAESIYNNFEHLMIELNISYLEFYYNGVNIKLYMLYEPVRYWIRHSKIYINNQMILKITKDTQQNKYEYWIVDQELLNNAISIVIYYLENYNKKIKVNKNKDKNIIIFNKLNKNRTTVSKFIDNILTLIKKYI